MPNRPARRVSAPAAAVVAEPLEARQLFAVTPAAVVHPMHADPVLTLAVRQAVARAAAGSTARAEPVAAPAVGTGLTGQYFEGDNFQRPVLVRTDPTVRFKWDGRSAPDPVLTAGEAFTVRWTGQIAPKTSRTYTFGTTARAGVRLWVNNTLLADNWDGPAAAPAQGTIALTGGQRYDVRMEYVRRAGDATSADVRLMWSAPKLKRQVVPTSALFAAEGVALPAGDGLTGTYYKGKDFSWPVMERADQAIDFDWGRGTPSAAMTSRAFSVRWQGRIEPEQTGAYTFYTTADDGVQLWVDGRLIIDDWNDHPAKENQGTIELEAGRKYDIRLNYYQNGKGHTSVKLHWANPGQPKQLVPPDAMSNTGMPEATARVEANAASTTRIDVSWEPVAVETGYVVERSNDGTTGWAEVGTTAAGVSTYADEGLAAGTAYFYRVRTANRNLRSVPSGVATDVTVPAAPANVAVVVGDTDATITWDAVTGATGYAVHRSLDGSTGWTTAGTTTATVLHQPGLNRGTKYHYRVVATNASGESAPSIVVQETTAPDAPADVAAVAAGRSVTVTWDAAPGATGYTVERSANGTSGWAGVGTTDGDTLAYTNTNLTAGTRYHYRVVAANQAGRSEASAAASDTTVPPTPASLTANAVSTSRIDLAWAAAPGTTTYVVERSNDGTTGWSQLATVAGTVTSYANTGLNAGTEYHYRVRATNAAGASGPTATASDVTVPPAPLSPAVVAAGTTATVTWAAATGAAGYTVERSLDGTTGWTSAGTTTTATTLADAGLARGTTYHYRVVATNGSGSSASSAVVSDTTAPAAPTGFAAVATGTTIDLTWDAMAGADSYAVERSADGSTGWAAVGAPTTAATLADAGLALGTTYHYRVTAANDAGPSEPSVVDADTTMPAAPLNAAAVAVGTDITVTWSPTPGATGYRVERSNPGAEKYVQVGDVLVATTLVDGELPEGRGFDYRIIAVNAAGDSDASNVATAYTVPPAVENVAAAAVLTTITVTWDPADAATGYAVERSPDGTTGWTSVGTTTSATTLADAGLANGTTYHYRVVAANAAGSSALSNVASDTTAPAAPANPTAAATGTSIAVAWDAAAGATQYGVERSPDGVNGWVQVGSLTGATTVTDAGLANGTTYHYRVTALNLAGSSAPSAAVSDVTAPAAATGASATAAGTDITVSWAAAAGATGYTVERSPNGGTGWAPAGSTAGTSLADVGLANGTTYFYRVIATNDAGDAAPSAVVNATTAPAAPATAAATAAGTTVTVTWSAAAAATTYVVERSPDGTNGWAAVGSPTSGTTLADAGRPAGATYHYRVIAGNAAGTSTPSNVASAAVLPAAPLGVTAAAAGTTITVNWSASGGATGYSVERSANGSTGWAQVGTTTGATTLADAGLPNGATRYYRVIATSGVGDSAASAAASATTAPAAPAGMVATTVSDTLINLTWGDVSAETGYLVERSADGTGGWTTAGTVAANATTFTVGGLAPSTTYYFRVSATSAAGTSAPSNVASGVTDAPIPAYAAQTSLYGLDGNAKVSLVNATTGAATEIGTMLFGTAAGGRDPVTGKFYYVESGTATPRLAVWNPADDSNVILSSLGSTGNVARAAFHPNGTFYLMGGNSALYSVDRETGVPTSLGDVSPAFPSGTGDMAFAPDGTLWVTVDGALYTVDLNTRAATSRGNPGINNFQMAFGQNGVMYGSANASMYTINTNTMVATMLGASGGFGDMASSPLYADLTVGQSASTLTAGQNGTYTITVANNGPQATTAPVTVVDTLPAGVTLVAASGNGWTFYQSGQTVTMIYTATVNPGTTLPAAVLTVAVSAGASANVTNTVSVSTTLFDTNTGNNVSSLTRPLID